MSNLEVLEKLVAGTSAAKEVIVNFEDNDYPFKLGKSWQNTLL